MISMTAYWQQFNDCIDNLQISTKDEEYSRLISVAKNLIEVGLRIEKLGITEIQQVVNQLHEKAKLFRHEVTYIANKEYTFYLPKITNTESLIFAIIYYQHLANYHHVSYQGDIYWFRQKVIDGINEKKITTVIQSKALLQEISKYCQNQNITVDESLFLKTEEESVKTYISRISRILSKQDEHPQTEAKASSQSEVMVVFEKSLADLQHKWNKLKAKADSIDQKLSKLNQARQNHLTLTKEWQNKWFITRAFYSFISLFFEVPEIKNLKMAEEQLIQAENEMNQELPHLVPESYLVTLQKQGQALKRKHVKIQKEIQQAKQKENTTDTPEVPMVCDSQKVAPKLEATEVNEPSSHLETSSNNDYFGFFKRHLPSQYAIQAIAVGAAAIVIQNL